MTAVSSPLDVYTRRVSFNNIDTDDQTESTLGFNSYNFLTTESPTHQKELDVTKFFGNYSMLTPTASFRKAVKLPEPPQKLILKNKLTPAQLRSNIASAAILGPDCPFSSAFDDDPEGDIDESLSSESEGEDEAPPPTVRRKLFQGLSDEELLALDPQFSKPQTSNLERFKFDSVTTYYSPARRTSALNITAQVAAAKQVVYPTLNENNYKSISLTLKHQDYDHSHIENRTLLTVISGRKHTWNSLDWLLLTPSNSANSTPASTQKPAGFLQDGDYLVVAALVPFKYLEAETKSNLKKKTIDENLHKKCDLILRFILDNLPDALIKLRITVELIMDVPPNSPNGTCSTSSKNHSKFGTKLMISHLYKQYNPSLVILGNRSTNLNFKYPLRIKNSVSGASGSKTSVSPASGLKNEREAAEFLIKLSSYMVKYSTVPVILVGNATVFHRKIERKQTVSVKFFGLPQPLRSILDIPPQNFRKNSAVSENSIESYTGGASSNEQRSINSTGDLKNDISELLYSSNEDRFAAMILEISQASLAALNLYLSLINDDTVDRLSREVTSSRVHQAYISSQLGKNALHKTNSGASGGAYKVKSLILYSEEDEKKNERMLHEKKLKKSVSRLSVVSSSSGKADEKKKQKRSFLLRIGLKKS